MPWRCLQHILTKYAENISKIRVAEQQYARTLPVLTGKSLAFSGSLTIQEAIVFLTTGIILHPPPFYR